MTTRLPGVGFIMMLSVMVCLPTPSRLTGLEAQQNGKGQRAKGKGQRAKGKGQRAKGKGQRAKGKGQRVQKKAFECTLRSTFFTNSDQE
ncbi:hypothetical protein QHE53_10115 [Aeromonas salmonicida]|uniref:hypothetical protein n=1 Tax=Aeromonas salmonicida TaxID=645 RepID=UPI00247B06DF|nr:hypothetical protein [Aeromonas salmonicida]MDH7627132.1 hypothetical protein [Aeromonas salmonicida]